jgi:hypothetical protein
VASENGDKFFFLVAARFQNSFVENRQFSVLSSSQCFFFFLFFVPQFCDVATMEIIQKEI